MYFIISFILLSLGIHNLGKDISLIYCFGYVLYLILGMMSI